MLENWANNTLKGQIVAINLKCVECFYVYIIKFNFKYIREMILNSYINKSCFKEYHENTIYLVQIKKIQTKASESEILEVTGEIKHSSPETNSAIIRKTSSLY